MDGDAPVAPRPADAATQLPATRASRSGAIVGSYRLLKLIGEGGMSAVYEAQHVEIGRIVAIKLLQRERAGDRRAMTQLAQEARIVASVNHPNVCEVHDLGMLADGRPYLVMELLRGETLASRIRHRGAIEAHDIVPILVQLLSALAAVHELGIIHRDLKPQNVFLTPGAGATPRVKLLDFGLSRSVNRDVTPILHPGRAAGTPLYMAPEQISDKQEPDSRVDVWGAGIILYEALSGQPPFWSPKFSALFHQITRSRHRPLYDVDPSIPLDLVAIVDRALAKDPDDRFSAAEFRDALFAMPWARDVVSTLSDRPGPASGPPRSSAPPPLDHVRRGRSGLPYIGHDSTETDFKSAGKDELETEVFELVKRTKGSKDGAPPRRNPGRTKR